MLARQHDCLLGCQQVSMTAGQGLHLQKPSALPALLHAFLCACRCYKACRWLRVVC